MASSFYWRNESSNLLSADFLRIVRPHLRPQGIFFYNTTWSDDVMATGLAVYPYALRFFNCLALSDSPITFDPARWKSILLSYSINGNHVINSEDPEQMKRLNEIVTLRHAAPLVAGNSIEEDDEIRLTGCGKSIFYAAVLTAAAKAGAENKPVIAALKRCATQNQVQYRVFPQPAKA